MVSSELRRTLQRFELEQRFELALTKPTRSYPQNYPVGPFSEGRTKLVLLASFLGLGASG